MATGKRILVLGGTSWLGGVLARQARDRGHDVTCLARGESGTPPPGTRLVRADRWREGGYDAVAGEDWDAVLDVSWQPELVRSALSALAGRTRHWVYVSSISVYADTATPGADESAETLPAWQGTGVASQEEYGPAKVSCETACREALPAERLLVARAGLIAGHGDRSDRFGYWPARFADGDSRHPVALVPPLDTGVQVVDVEDLASWLVSVAEERVAGVFDATGDPASFQDVVDAYTEVAGTRPSLAPATQDWLIERGVHPWAGPESLPLWLPLPDYAGHATRNNGAAVRAGLSPRPLSETVRGALAWESELGLTRERRAGLSAARERALLADLLGDTSP